MPPLTRRKLAQQDNDELAKHQSNKQADAPNPTPTNITSISNLTSLCHSLNKPAIPAFHETSTSAKEIMTRSNSCDTVAGADALEPITQLEPSVIYAQSPDTIVYGVDPVFDTKFIRGRVTGDGNCYWRSLAVI